MSQQRRHSKPSHLTRLRHSLRWKTAEQYQNTFFNMAGDLSSYPDFVDSLETRIVPAGEVSKDSTCSICLDSFRYAEISPPKQRIGLACLERPKSRPSSRHSHSDTGRPQSWRRMSSLGRPSTTDNSPVRVPCGHVFGKDCVEEWLRTSNQCPLCRREMCQKSSVHIAGDVRLGLFEEPEDDYATTTYDDIPIFDNGNAANSLFYSDLCRYIELRLV